MKKIIVFQSDKAGYRMCLSALMACYPPIRPDDFVTLADPCELEALLHPETPQLFITGSINGMLDGVVDMIKNAKSINPKLVVIGFSVNVLPGPVDYQILKSANPNPERSLSTLAQVFLGGALPPFQNTV